MCRGFMAKTFNEGSGGHSCEHTNIIMITRSLLSRGRSLNEPNKPYVQNKKDGSKSRSVLRTYIVLSANHLTINSGVVVTCVAIR